MTLSFPRIFFKFIFSVTLPCMITLYVCMCVLLVGETSKYKNLSSFKWKIKTKKKFATHIIIVEVAFETLDVKILKYFIF